MAGEERDKYFRIKVYEYSAMIDEAHVMVESIVDWSTKRLLAVHDSTLSRNAWLEEKVDNLLEKVKKVIPASNANERTYGNIAVQATSVDLLETVSEEESAEGSAAPVGGAIAGAPIVSAQPPESI